MSNKQIKLLNGKKKYIFYILIFFFLIYFIINFMSALFQNKMLSLVNSQKFQNFIILRVENYLEKISEGDLSEKEIEYYSNLLNKINKKFKPVIERLEK